MFQFHLDNEKEMREWDNYVLSHKSGTPFHLSPWIQTIYYSYKFKPLLFVEKDTNDCIIGIFPSFLINSLINGNRIVSIPFSDYGGNLFNNEIDFENLFSNFINKYEHKFKYLEIRCPLPNGSMGVRHDYYKRHMLELSSNPQDVKKKINKRTIQYSIKKAIKSGVTIEEDNTLNGVMHFYRLNALTRKKHGVPSQPKKYFINLFKNMIQSGLAYIITAKANEKTIAASMFFKFKDTIHYKYNASDPAYIKSHNPNHLLTWHAIERSCNEGYHLFDFGRTSPDNEGLMRYKKMWGAQPISCPYQYYPQIMGITSIQEDGLLYKVLTRTWKRLPYFINQIISEWLYRHMA